MRETHLTGSCLNLPDLSSNREYSISVILLHPPTAISMSPTVPSTDWTSFIEQDPYALLGVPVNANERQILKRYRQIAKQLHPDMQIGKDENSSKFARQTMAQLVNPAYQRLKLAKIRSETLTLMRFQVKQLVQTQQLLPTTRSAQQLLRLPDSEVGAMYDQAVSQLVPAQFTSASAFHSAVTELNQLNLSFLSCKTQEPELAPKRTELMLAPPSTSATTTDQPPIDYARLHQTRAQTYMRQQNYSMAVQELREALKLEPKNVEFHSLLGQAYYVQKMVGMARAHFRQALSIDPNHSVARKYARILKITNLPSRRPAKTPDTSFSASLPSWLGRCRNRSGGG